MVNDFWLKNKHTISIFQAQVRDLAKHIETQPKKHNAYRKKKRVPHLLYTTCPQELIRGYNHCSLRKYVTNLRSAVDIFLIISF